MLQKKLLCACTLLALCSAGNALAAVPPDCTAKEQGGTLTSSTYSVMERAIEDLSKDYFQDAERRLLDVSTKVKGYERAVIYQTLGFVYAQQDKLVPALEAFEIALAEKALPLQPHQDLMVNTGQIYLANGQYDKGIATLEAYLQEACKPPSADVHLALASAYAEAKRYREALVQINLALEKSSQPQEAWLQLKLALHFELEEMEQSAETLLQLIALVPGKEDYWKQLSGVLLQIEKDQDALAVLAIAERQGFLKSERDVKNLANIYLMLDIPYKAGSLLSRAMTQNLVSETADNLEYLSEAWIVAREWDDAESALRRAAEAGNAGSLWQRLAQVQMEQEDWQGAHTSMERAVASGVDDIGQATYLLGIAAYNAGDARAAKRALMQSVRQSSSRQQAQQWLDHLEHEERNATRAQRMQEALENSEG